MKNVFDEIIEYLQHRQREEDLFANVNRDNDFYRAMHESKISAFGDAIDIINLVTSELWISSEQEPAVDGEYIVHCRRCRDGKETVSSAKYRFGEWKISNAFDLIGWMSYHRLFNMEQEVIT